MIYRVFKGFFIEILRNNQKFHKFRKFRKWVVSYNLSR